MSKVTVEVPATTANLGPGFDCVGLALGIFNRIEAEAVDHAGWEIQVEGAGEAELPRHRQNLVALAMEEVFDQAASPPAGVRLRLINRIPLCSGLGSSAAARVGGLVAANELCGRPLGTGELARLAAEMEGHPDNVVPALVGGLTVAVLDSGRLNYVRFEPPPLSAVVAVPAQRLATTESRRALPEEYSRADTVFNIGRAALLIAALVGRQHEALTEAMDDRVHQPYRLGMIPGARQVLAAAREAGALGAVLSGSGPSLLALCDGAADEVSAAMRAAWTAAGVESTTHQLELTSAGASVVWR